MINTGGDLKAQFKGYQLKTATESLWTVFIC